MTATLNETAPALTEFTLQYSGVTQKKNNTSYPFTAVIHSIDDLKKVAAFDNIGAQHSDGKNNRGKLIKGYRSVKTYKQANCLPVEVDNEQKDPLKPDIPPEEWVTPADVAAAFPGVPFYVVYSRHHMKEKNGKPARPRFHVYFIMNTVTDVDRFAALKLKALEHFPQFDSDAMDRAHFFYGVENPQVEYYPGNIPVDTFLVNLDKLPDVIPVGTRNNTLSKYAAKILKRNGDTDKAFELFQQAADRCEQPLEESELKTIWNSAQGFFHKEIESSPDYIPPDAYELADFTSGGGKKKKPVTSDDVKKVLAEMNITVRLNLISGMVEVNGLPKAYSKENAANTLPVLLMDYFTKHNMKCSRTTLDDCLVLIEDENRFNPVEEMLKSTTWDGHDYLKDLAEILGIADNERETLYLNKWCHQTISLALNDDVEPYGADGVLTIQGDQGAGKTLFFATIAVKSDWFAEGVSIDLGKKDTVIQSTGCWIAELGELDSTLKKEQSALKAFLTSRTDTYRLPYAHAQTRRPRRTSFCATVNPKEFLNDETGSRRFWVIHPSPLDVERVKGLSAEWVKQMWAQVYETLYKKDVQGFRLTKEELQTLQLENEQYSKPLAGEIEITDNLDFDAPLDKWHWVKVSALLNHAGIRGVSSMQAGRVLAKLAAQDKRIQVKNVHNVKQYLLPPLSAYEEFPRTGADVEPLLGPL
ncbi:VapE domain-containing protein [Catenisphaera adipataccumulans]|uniref:Primase C-terminal 1 domain-containing protein n=1 Tax=Catenisphaera adipataccumulans TaxID=700500 RepID=A0A7W8FU46_9FIRM|nr:VapE domain-containing protein [Catenisphaera adipataccumulans]MBB5182214.1 hypothetical protein [Catenisphaera adipataccumulans]